MSIADAAVPADVVESTLGHFDELDRAKDEAAMQELATRLGREQPAILEYAASLGAELGEAAGQAAVFYTTLVWTMFDRHAGLELPRVTTDNVRQAETFIDTARGALGDLEPLEAAERVAPELRERQPHVTGKLGGLLAEDVRGEALTAELAASSARVIQVVIEALDAAISGRRQGITRAPKRKGPKVGRNVPCPCGSGKKFKRCCA